jgi:hypothetical protein
MDLLHALNTPYRWRPGQLRGWLTFIQPCLYVTENNLEIFPLVSLKVQKEVSFSIAVIRIILLLITQPLSVVNISLTRVIVNHAVSPRQ